MTLHFSSAGRYARKMWKSITTMSSMIACTGGVGRKPNEREPVTGSTGLGVGGWKGEEWRDMRTVQWQQGSSGMDGRVQASSVQGAAALGDPSFP